MVWDMTGFKITNIDFHQDVELPAGVYTYSCKLTPVYDYLIFRVGETDFTITNLQPGVYQKGVKLTFTLEEDENKFYPSRTVGDEIFDIMLEEGDKDTTPGPHILDNSEEISRAGIQINDELIRLYAKKSEVSSQILQSAENINIRVDGVDDRLAEVDISINSITSRVIDAEGRLSEVDVSAKAIDLRVDDLNDDLEATGINIQDKKIEITTDQFIVKGNAGGDPYLMIGVDSDGIPKFKAEHIDANFLTADRIDALQTTSKIVRTAAYGSRTEIEGNTIKIFNDTSIFPNIVFGMKNGYAVMEYYDNAGVMLYDLGPEGISMVDVVEEAWIEVSNLLFLGIDYTTVLTTPAIKSKYKRPLLQSQVPYYKYQSQRIGNVVSDPDNDGRLFVSPSKAANKIPIGVYCLRQNAFQYNLFGQPYSIPTRQHPSNESYYTSSAYQIYFQSLYNSSPASPGLIDSSVYDAYWSEKIGLPPAEP